MIFPEIFFRTIHEQIQKVPQDKEKGAYDLMDLSMTSSISAVFGISEDYN